MSYPREVCTITVNKLRQSLLVSQEWGGELILAGTKLYMKVLVVGRKLLLLGDLSTLKIVSLGYCNISLEYLRN